MRQRITLGLCLFLFAGATSAQRPAVPQAPTVSTETNDVGPPEHPATEDQIREYLSLIGTDRLAHEMMDRMADAMQATSAPYLPASFWDDMRAQFRKFDLVTPYVTVYQRYLSRDEMQAVIGFYRSPAGQKLLTAQPLAIRDVQGIVRETAQQIGVKVYERHAAEIQAAKVKYESDAAAKAGKKH